MGAGVAGSLAIAGSWLVPGPANALEVEITGGGSDRLERQSAWANKKLPLPGTPDLARLTERLSAKGLKEGAPIFLRIFKEESELELWLKKGDAFERFATYPICQWSGVLGPKFYEGDNQSPEGFYTVDRRQLKWKTKHHRAFNIGFPNAFDKAQGRTGSNILVHGGCSTEGCFAMTDAVIDEIFRLANAALSSGQKSFGVHIFPFRMTVANLAAQTDQQWLPYWLNLKTGYDLFEATRIPPVVDVCQDRYAFAHPQAAKDGGTVCAPVRVAAVNSSDPDAATDEHRDAPLASAAIKTGSIPLPVKADRSAAPQPTGRLVPASAVPAQATVKASEPPPRRREGRQASPRAAAEAPAPRRAPPRVRSSRTVNRDAGGIDYKPMAWPGRSPG